MNATQYIDSVVADLRVYQARQDHASQRENQRANWVNAEVIQALTRCTTQDASDALEATYPVTVMDAIDAYLARPTPQELLLLRAHIVNEKARRQATKPITDDLIEAFARCIRTGPEDIIGAVAALQGAYAQEVRHRAEREWAQREAA